MDAGRRYRETRMSAAEAREKYPDWYERVVEGGERGQWVVKRDLYDWWLRKVRGGATYGHRYFCIMALAIYAAKCGIYDREEVKEAAMGLVPHLDSLNPEHPFTEADVDSALECLDGRYATFPRSDIARLTDIEIPPNKRNGRKQEQHMAIMRAIQSVTDAEGKWRNKNGAPTKRDAIRAYAAEHTDASHSEIARALGVSRPTVIKWLKPGWREEWDEAVRRMDAATVTPIPLTDDEIAWTPEAVAVRASGGKIVGLNARDMAKVMLGTYDPGRKLHLPARQQGGMAAGIQPPKNANANEKKSTKPYTEKRQNRENVRRSRWPSTQKAGSGRFRVQQADGGERHKGTGARGPRRAARKHRLHRRVRPERHRRQALRPLPARPAGTREGPPTGSCTSGRGRAGRQTPSAIRGSSTSSRNS